jgi:hypothetical protein
MHGPLQSFDLGAEVARLREEEAFRGGRRNSITLRKGEGMSVVQSASGEFAYLTVHRRRGPVHLAPRGGKGDDIGECSITGRRSNA